MWSCSIYTFFIFYLGVACGRAISSYLSVPQKLQVKKAMYKDKGFHTVVQIGYSFISLTQQQIQRSAVDTPQNHLHRMIGKYILIQMVSTTEYQVTIYEATRL